MRLLKTARNSGIAGDVVRLDLVRRLPGFVTKCQDINFPERNPQGEQTCRTTTNCRRIPITSFRCGPAHRGQQRPGGEWLRVH